MILDCISSMLERCSTPHSTFPATDLFNESWMLRLVLEWFSQHPEVAHPLSVPSGCRWYSEALLPSAFLQRRRGDKFAEAWTHADGVVGHFEIGRDRKRDLTLAPAASCLKVVEAKMFSKLSSGTTRAKYFNQAARSVACIAEVLKRADSSAAAMDALAFFLLAPREKVDAGTFSGIMTVDSVRAVVGRRVLEYDEPRDEWYEKWFLPTLERIDIRTIAWEDVASLVQGHDPEFGKELAEFYEQCLTFNRQARTRRSKR